MVGVRVKGDLLKHQLYRTTFDLLLATIFTFIAFNSGLYCLTQTSHEHHQQYNTITALITHAWSTTKAESEARAVAVEGRWCAGTKGIQQ